MALALSCPFRPVQNRFGWIRWQVSEIHRIEGRVRVIVGLLGALFLALAIKANLVLGLSQTWSHPMLALLIFCIVAGGSERLVPGLIKSMENSVGQDKKRR